MELEADLYECIKPYRLVTENTHTICFDFLKGIYDLIIMYICLHLYHWTLWETIWSISIGLVKDLKVTIMPQ